MICLAVCLPIIRLAFKDHGKQVLTLNTQIISEKEKKISISQISCLRQFLQLSKIMNDTFGFAPFCQI
jgi:hypothetical protein